MTGSTYEAAGVDLDAAQEIKRRIGAIAAPTRGPDVLSGAGAFGAMYRLAGYEEPVLVCSTDGVGTKLDVAAMMGRYDHIGEDLVNACVNDVIVSGARPLLFLDYVAMPKLDAEVVEALIRGMTRACQEAGCALAGGETAQMPGAQGGGGVELAGFAVGVVEKRAVLDPSTVREGDVLVGVPSNGLHTNGYSLARHVFRLAQDPSPLTEHDPRLGETLGEALLRPHRGYYRVVEAAFPLVKAMAHVTGGGLIENVPRMLPEGLAAQFDEAVWPVPPIFSVIQEKGGVARDEMYRVFNMGLGLVMACGPGDEAALLAAVPGAVPVGRVTLSAGGGRVIL